MACNKMVINDDIDYKAAFEHACLVLEALETVCCGYKKHITADEYQKTIIEVIRKESKNETNKEINH